MLNKLIFTVYKNNCSSIISSQMNLISKKEYFSQLIFFDEKYLHSR